MKEMTLKNFGKELVDEDGQNFSRQEAQTYIENECKIKELDNGKALIRDESTDIDNQLVIITDWY